MTSFSHRVFGAAVLDRGAYEEVEADQTATTQAFFIVVLSSLAIGIGAAGFVGGSWNNVLVMSVAALLGWAAWALVTMQVGGRLLREPQTRVDVGELLRTTGFATAPGLLGVFAVVPELAAPVFVVTAVWMLVAMVVAVRQALDYESITRAIGVCILGWLLAAVFVVVIGLWLTPPLS